MKIGLAQINTTVGDLSGNRKRILAAYKRLLAEGAELVLFPELVITGYPPRDLLFKSRFVRDNLKVLEEIAAQTGEVPAVVGFVDPAAGETGRHAYNAAAWCANGKVQAVGRKCLLPTYDVFDEDRYFEPAKESLVMEWRGRKVGVTICEDIWPDPASTTRHKYNFDPVAELSHVGLDLMLNLSASPWFYGKARFRSGIVGGAAIKCGCPVVYCNAIGGNDELIFDGHSMVTNAEGKVIAGLNGFAEDIRVVDLEAEHKECSATFSQDEMTDIHDALVLGLRDYAHKSGFKRAILGLSGGIDSAVVAVLAVEAFGRENVIGVSLPSSISSQHSKDDARDLAENLGIRFETLPISNIVQAAESALSPVFNDLPRDVTEENIQARSRGVLLMAMSNKFGALLLTTGNKSEVSVGYCTLYGDMCGGLAVISDVPKTKVFELARWMNRNEEVIPENTITKPPSAELRPDQKDEDSLPPYEILDEILRLYIEESLSAVEIIEKGFEEATVRDVVRKVDLNEYKRKQAAPGLKVTPVAFGVGRRIPIVQKYVS